MPLVVIGVLLVLGCALMFADVAAHQGGREEVLVVAQPVAAGQVLTTADLRAGRMSTGSGLDVVATTGEAGVLGRRAAEPLVAGSLLTMGEIGSATAASTDADVVAVGLKAGAYPPDLAPGDRVQVVPVTSEGGGNSSSVTSGSPVRATILEVTPGAADSNSPTVFSLQVASGDADEVAALAAAGQASLIQVGGAG